MKKENLLKSLVGITLLGSLTGCMSEYIKDDKIVNNVVDYDSESKPTPDEMGNLPISINNSNPLYTGKVVELNSSNFDDFVKEGNRIVLFYASWDNRYYSDKARYDLKAVASKEYTVNLGEIDFVGNKQFYKTLSQRRIREKKHPIIFAPSIIFYKNGEDVLYHNGPLSESELESKIKEIYPN